MTGTHAGRNILNSTISISNAIRGTTATSLWHRYCHVMLCLKSTNSPGWSCSKWRCIGEQEKPGTAQSMPHCLHSHHSKPPCCSCSSLHTTPQLFSGDGNVVPVFFSLFQHLKITYPHMHTWMHAHTHTHRQTDRQTVACTGSVPALHMGLDHSMLGSVWAFWDTHRYENVLYDMSTLHRSETLS